MANIVSLLRNSTFPESQSGRPLKRQKKGGLMEEPAHVKELIDG